METIRDRSAAAIDTLLPAMLDFLGRDSERLARFCDATGLDLSQVRAVATEPAFAAGLLDYLCSDDRLLLAFSQDCGIDPALVERERQRLAAVGVDPC